ncbi:MULTISPECIES: exodeoxyribonuclease VII small subunit [unclassified Thomasclavelia]|uniref:Exodeoxyribonuclease 7 small subunit n=1 Tax=Candidatus Erysipelatoclostridium merdavium TaxID=2838566 RepID=A0A9D1XJU8_9FIRM|nr:MULTISPECIES: exodeoxyribonuclease VII small subunit [unclassified Thomasclavelia]OUP79041.1 exodeoxyribonuclease VII small subunit [Erysipelatoclostridium sp. An173]OUQ09336.1 exodeoxyribonuclease VII small subunit [Erysipelatoclostridium sp. An15]HIX80659.1 exodeoxyribonuclease VII small subunit [Candidatus Erysipelatoclostridium merdavium]
MENITFEEAMKRLEEIVAALENNQVSLEKSVDLFQEGIKLSKICNDKLNNIEDKVAKILVDDKLEDLEIEDKNG